MENQRKDNTISKKKKSFFKSEWFDVLIKVIIFALLVTITFSLILGAQTISSDYMAPNIKHKDTVIYSRIDTDYVLHDVLVYVGPDGETYVGRVVGFPKDNIMIDKTGSVFRNGFTEVEDSVYLKGSDLEEIYAELGEDEYYVVADNRQFLADSRTFGPIKKSQIKGAVITVVRRFGI